MTRLLAIVLLGLAIALAPTLGEAQTRVPDHVYLLNVSGESTTGLACQVNATGRHVSVSDSSSSAGDVRSGQRE